MPSDKLLEIFLKLDSRLQEYGDGAVFAEVKEVIPFLENLDLEPQKTLIRWDG